MNGVNLEMGEQKFFPAVSITARCSFGSLCRLHWLVAAHCCFCWLWREISSLNSRSRTVTRHDQGLPTPTCHFGRSDLSWVDIELNTKDCCCCIDLCTMTCMPFSFLSENLAKSNEGNYGNNPSKWPENWSVNITVSTISRFPPQWKEDLFRYFMINEDACAQRRAYIPCSLSVLAAYFRKDANNLRRAVQTHREYKAFCSEHGYRTRHDPHCIPAMQPQLPDSLAYGTKLAQVDDARNIPSLCELDTCII